MLDFKDFKDIDLKLHLISGSEIKIENLVIKPYTLEEIKNYGYSNYMKNIQMMSISMDDFISSIEDDSKRAVLEEQRANLMTFDFYIKFGGEELLYSLLFALMMVFRTDDVRMLDDKIIAIDFIKKGFLDYDENGNIFSTSNFENANEDEIKLIHRENFDNIAKIVQLQNYLIKPEVKIEEEELYADEETRKLMEEMARHRKKVEEKKKAQRESDENENIDISDIISAISSKSNSINRFNIWQFTLYQIYDEYSRLELIDNYDFSIRALMAGAKDIDFKHWSSKI